MAGRDKKIFYVTFTTCEESVPPDLPKDILEKEVLKPSRLSGG
jgi:hypothetical protein